MIRQECKKQSPFLKNSLQKAQWIKNTEYAVDMERKTWIDKKWKHYLCMHIIFTERNNSEVLLQLWDSENCHNALNSITAMMPYIPFTNFTNSNKISQPYYYV